MAGLIIQTAKACWLVVELYQEMRQVVVAILFCVMNCSTYDAFETSGSVAADCRSRRDLVGECFKVRGRLRGYTSPPPCRIWPVGSKRLLAIAEHSGLPSNVACGPEFEVYADYLVCPLTKQPEVGMQTVCVASASNIRANEVQPESR